LKLSSNATRRVQFIASRFNLLTTSCQQPQPERPFSEHDSPPIADFQLPQFSEVLPEGDPFAQRTAPYIPVEQEQQPPLPLPKPKRKRKVRREDTCSFCRGDESQNKLGQPEILLTCHECGRSGAFLDIVETEKELTPPRPSQLYAAYKCNRRCAYVSMEMH
jgi:hypothetical protein